MVAYSLIVNLLETQMSLMQLLCSIHLSGCRHELAVEVLNAYESTLEGDVMPSERYEHSEMLLYRASILEESGQTKEALEGLDKSKDLILDKLGALDLKARLLMQHGDLEKAQAVYYKLLSINPDNYRYHDGLKEVLTLSKKASVVRIVAFTCDMNRPILSIRMRCAKQERTVDQRHLA